MSLYKDSSLAMIPTAYKDGKLYSVRPTDGSGDFTFSRGSNLAATRVASSGYIEKGRENLLLQSNSFSTSPFVTSSVSVTSGQAGYDGTNDAWELSTTGINGFENLYQNISFTGVHTISIYAKAGSNAYLTIRSLTSDFRVQFKLDDGTHSTTFGSPIDTFMEDAGAGWYRCGFTANFSSASSLVFYPQRIGVVDAGNIYIQDAQLEQGLVATDVITTTTTSVSAGILEDMPRLDYSGSCPSLLLEPQRSNIAGYSEYFGDSYWTKYRSSVNSNVTTSPDGYNSAFEIIEDNTTNTHIIGRSFSFTSGTTYSGSIFAKYNGRNLMLSAGNTSTWSAKALFDLENGSVNSTILGSATIEDYGNGWYRCTIIGTANATSSTNFNIQLLNGFTGNYLGDGSSGSYFYGVQLEAGSYPTSYIPTYGSSVTRSADSCEGAGDTSTFNDSEGVLYAEIASLTDDNDGSKSISISSGAYSNNIIIQYTTNTNQIVFKTSPSYTTPIFQSYNVSDITENSKIAFKYKSNDCSFWHNGVKLGSVSSFTPFHMGH